MPDADLPPYILRVDPPDATWRTWPLAADITEARRANPLLQPEAEMLIPCSVCGRKTSRRPALAQLRLWWVQRVSVGGASWNYARVRCADTDDCDAYVQERERKKREAAARRRPALPHEDAPPGSCKWCGEVIRFNEGMKGWKRRRRRNYHYGDEWEATDKDCLRLSLAWRDPKAAEQELLDRQGGCCNVCGRVLAERAEDHHRYYRLGGHYWHPVAKDLPTNCLGGYSIARIGELWRVSPQLGRHDEIALVSCAYEVDHILPLADGGTNALENLQVICANPCHREKTAREAGERAKRRRAERGEDR